jgi:biopolymer transport protein ExbB/TolQ
LPALPAFVLCCRFPSHILFRTFAGQLEQVQREREVERRQLQEETEALREGGTEKMSSAELQRYYDIREELERMRSKSEAAEKELAEMRLLMRPEKVQCFTLRPSSSCFRFAPISHAMQI